jgi:hypothetical protein
MVVNQSQPFAATVLNTTNTSVTWSMNPSLSGSALTTAGVYTAPVSFTAGQTVTITATSVADPTKSGSATVTLQPRQSIGSVSAYGNGSTAFYSGNLPADYSVQLPGCSGSSSDYYAYARSSSSGWYQVETGSFNSIWLSAYDSSANESQGSLYTLGVALTSSASCSQEVMLTVHGASIFVLADGQRVLSVDDYVASSGNAGLKANTTPVAWATALIWPADNIPPTVPTGVAAASASDAVVVSWSPSVDVESRVWGYTVYRNGVIYAGAYAPATTFTDYRVRPGPNYTYSVNATDNEMNTSEMSASVSITIPGGAAVPTLTQVSPSSAEAGTLPPGWTFWLTVYGTAFMPDSYIQWNGGALETTWVSRTLLVAKVDPANLASPRTAQITVLTPAPGGGTSNSMPFTVTGAATNPVPAISSLSPTSIAAGSSAFTLTVNGSNFVSGSLVQWNGSGRPTTYVSSTQLAATITANDVASTGTAQVTVFNPPPGGGTSTNSLTFSTIFLQASAGAQPGCADPGYCTNPVPVTNITGVWIDAGSSWALSSSGNSVSGTVTVAHPYPAICPPVVYTVTGSISPSSQVDYSQGRTGFNWTASSPSPSTECGTWTPIPWMIYYGNMQNNGNDLGIGRYLRPAEPNDPNAPRTGPITVTKNPADIPTAETTQAVGFSTGALATVGQFRQTLVAGSGSADIFKGRQVSEATGDGTNYDNCWFPGSIVAKWTTVQGSNWNVGYYLFLDNTWVDDYIGWNTAQVNYYRTHLQPSSFPCEAKVPQVMKIAVNGTSGATAAYKSHWVGAQIYVDHVTVNRDGQSQTTNQ